MRSFSLPPDSGRFDSNPVPSALTVQPALWFVPLSFVSRAGETPLFSFPALWHHFEPLIQSEGFHSSGSSVSRFHTAHTNFGASSATPFPGLFHPGSTYGLYSPGVSPPTTVRLLSQASSSRAVTAKVATLSASASPRSQRDSQSVQLQSLCPSPESVLVACRV